MQPKIQTGYIASGPSRRGDRTVNPNVAGSNPALAAMKKTINPSKKPLTSKQVKVRVTTEVIIPVSVFNYDCDGAFIQAPPNTLDLFVHIETMAENLGMDVEAVLWECEVVQNIVELELDVL